MPHNIADVYFRQGKLAEALTTCEERLAPSRTYGRRHAPSHGAERQQEGPSASSGQAASSYIQEAVAIFRDTGSRHLADAEWTLQTIQEKMARERN